MKATFGGIEVEGTPAEIADLVRLTQGFKLEPIIVPVVVPQPQTPWWWQQPIIWGGTGTSDATKVGYSDGLIITCTGTGAVTMQ